MTDNSNQHDEVDGDDENKSHVRENEDRRPAVASFHTIFVTIFRKVRLVLWGLVVIRVFFWSSIEEGYIVEDNIVTFPLKFTSIWIVLYQIGGRTAGFEVALRIRDVVMAKELKSENEPADTNVNKCPNCDSKLLALALSCDGILDGVHLTVHLYHLFIWFLINLL